MTQRLEILFLAHRIPYPPDKGDKIRSWRLLKRLTERFDVHLACFIDDPRDLEHQDYLRSLCRSASFVQINPLARKLTSLRGLLSGTPLSCDFYRTEKMAKEIAPIRARELSDEIVFSSPRAQYIAQPIAGRPRIVDFCDADSEKWRDYAKSGSGLMKRLYAREAQRLAEQETDIANWADVSFAATPAEAIIFNARPSVRKSVSWWANGVDTEHFDPSEISRLPTQTPDVVFVGAMDYRPNVNAVTEFFQKSWPTIRQVFPSARLAVVGTNPAKCIERLDDRDGVIVTGRVDDVRPWLKSAKAVIAPLSVARGIQNKVLEAMAMAKPVVATSAAAAGVCAEHGKNILIADDPVSTAAAVTRLLGDSETASRLGLAARRSMIERHDWSAQLARFDAGLDLAIEESMPPKPQELSAG